MNRVLVVPVGEVDEAILSRLLPCLEERFLFTFVRTPLIAPPENAYNMIKKKYLSSAICDRIGLSMPSDVKCAIGITELDTYDNCSNFVYNHVRAEERTGLVSLFRLNPQNCLQPAEKDSFFQRVLKETTHEMGHLMGFRHCFNNLCVMYFSYSLSDTDRKGTFFCQECERKLNRLISSP